MENQQVNNQMTLGFLATTVEEYVDSLIKIDSLESDLEMRHRARQQAMKFKEKEFQMQFLEILKLVK